ncbi:rho guanine nucleotide exchange factor 38 [Amia ocellicauda]|uniref:rho guanine nucleotide exchange factor 38 n=1 Tax=Amia ocellicauda TaxID=2972642 RepID=UPI003464BDF6
MDHAKEAGAKDNVFKRRPRLLLRPKLYLERRKTDSIVADDNCKGDINIGTLVRRSQSDRTEYSTKLKEKMAPLDLSAPASPASPALSPQETRLRKMLRRSKVIQELVQTERDYLTDLELCIREVVQPLRELQVVDVDRLFTNIDSVCNVSAELLFKLKMATAEPDPELQKIGDIFIQNKAELEEVYKIYCYHHDDANSLLKTYEKDEEIRQRFRACVASLKQIYDSEGKPNLLDMGSLLIKPVQRVMKYPLLLGELWNATPDEHPDRWPLEEALTTVKIINININEFRRRKDIVMKYKKPDEEATLMEKLNRFTIHSIKKKSTRAIMKMFPGVESQVKDEIFDREEKVFRNLDKAVRQLVKNVCCYLHHTQEIISVAVQNVQDLENILQDPDELDTNGSKYRKNDDNPYLHFKDKLERLVLTPLSVLQAMFVAPQKLIQKRYDKLLDCCSRTERPSSEEPGFARRDFEALNAQMVEELQRFNTAARTILNNCVCCLAALLRDLMRSAQQKSPPIQQLPAPLSNISEVQTSVMEQLNNLLFVKENAQKLMERKVSFEKPRKVLPEIPRQSEAQRTRLLTSYPVEQLYQLKRNCNATQEHDVSLFEGELVAVVEQTDPLGSTSRWLVDTGGPQGYVYSSFLKPYNPTRDLNGSIPEQHDDFDNISLFVSGSAGGSLRRYRGDRGDRGDRGSTVSEQPDTEALEGTGSDDQQFYAVYAFQARCEQELSLQEYQHVRILKFCDLSGNKEWWLAESDGHKGYVPANYLGRMSYA